MKNKPVLLMIIASLGFSFNPVITKILTGEISATGVLLLRFLFASLLFPIIAITLGKHTIKSFFAIKPKQLLVFFLLSFLLVGNMLLFFNSFYYTTVNRALFIFLMYPVVAMLMARIIVKETITKNDMAASFLSLIGVIAIFWGSDLGSKSLAGDVMVLFSMLIWCGFMILNRFTALRDLHFRQTFWLFLFSFLLFVPSYLILGLGQPISNISLKGSFLILVIVVFSTLIPYSLINYASNRIKTSTIGFLLLLGQVISIFLSFLILKENPDANVIIGGLLVVFSAVMSIYSLERLFSFKEYLKAIKMHKSFKRILNIFRR